MDGSGGVRRRMPDEPARLRRRRHDAELRLPQAEALLTGKIGTIISNNLQKQRKEKPSYDERSSTGKAGCGKSAHPV